MSEILDYEFLFKHAETWVFRNRWRESAAVASAYAKWYANNYPKGDKEHTIAFDYWQTQVTRKAAIK